ncbi:5'/3'-nucleotidase SurE [Pseudaeromonas paramecii]|uniref:5'-nucleotidase n=1 Tax=Pseudaeromonas paramecii TaxID=2138166 RepID=A0ABP8PYQ7_9GAMM
MAITRASLLATTLALAAYSQSASALNILLTNDDSWSTENIQVLFSKLQAAGHNVILSAPCTGQSGKGGAINFMKSVSVDRSKVDEQQACVGDTDTSVAFKNFVEGTPVMAALYGIDVLAPEIWGSAPDLLISGPNEGNNLGYMTNNSGTLGAANVAIARGVPAVAVSAATSDADNAAKVADEVVKLVAKLDASRASGEPLLPAFTGLNVNTPEDMSNVAGYRFAQVGWNAGGYDVKFAADLSTDSTTMGYVAQALLAAGYATSFEAAYAMAQQQYAGKAGVTFVNDGLVADDNANSEGVLLGQGYITISTIQANVQGSQSKDAVTRAKLASLAE